MSELPWSEEVKLPVLPASASRARDFVRRLLTTHGMTELNDDVALVVSELATNAIVHAQTPFTVSLEVSAHTLLLTVADRSPADPVLVAARAFDPGGRGLTIVALLSRDWGAYPHPDGGKSVWAEFDLPRRPPGRG
jgi:anti-sigma regulatory factor (Ser/Thr protein kinase)